MTMAETYDYVVVGSGAAGSVLAARLAESQQGSICVLEAGDHDKRLFVKMPAGFVKNLTNPAMMWQFKSKAGPNTADRQVYLPQGKILGGSTSINGLIYNRGQAADFDHWASLGNEGWSYQDVLPLFRRSETRTDVESQFRGSHGPLRISDPDQTHPLCDAFIESVSALTGAAKHNDYNAAIQRGTGYYQRFIHKGVRETVAANFLSPAKKHGIDIRANSVVQRLIVKDKNVVGVEVQRAGVTEKVLARKEVLLCAGTVNSARLLQLSGIGDGDHLQALGIPVKHHLPGVGENFQDHYFVRLAVSLQPGTDSLNSQSRGVSLAREVVRWMMGRPSILSWSPSIAYAFLNTDQLGDDLTLSRSSDDTARPDLQFVFSHGSYRPGRVYELDTFPAVTCGFTQQRPESRGYVRITSTDIHQMPEVQPNYLESEYDQKIAIKGVRMARHFLQGAQLSGHYKKEEVPGVDIQSDDEILDYARRTGNTGYHLVGTCMMGPSSNKMAVVAPDLRVHGLDGLRVIDASIMPTVTSSNTCAASIMIGEKGAELVMNS